MYSCSNGCCLYGHFLYTPLSNSLILILLLYFPSTHTTYDCLNTHRYQHPRPPPSPYLRLAWLLYPYFFNPQSLSQPWNRIARFAYLTNASWLSCSKTKGFEDLIRQIGLCDVMEWSIWLSIDFNSEEDLSVTSICSCRWSFALSSSQSPWSPYQYTTCLPQPGMYMLGCFLST